MLKLAKQLAAFSLFLFGSLACKEPRPEQIPETVSRWDLISEPNQPAYYAGTNIKYSGIVLDYYNDKKTLKYRANFREGFPSGEESEYYFSGKLRRKCIYENGGKNGPEFHWHPNGSTQSTTNYVNGLPDGKCHYWTTNGIKTLTAVYTTGKLISLLSFHNSGTPKRFSEMIDGIQNGYSKQWYANGKLEWVAPYFNGVKHGLAIGWIQNGNKSWESEWNNGQSHGLSKKWHPNGNMKSVTTFKKGLKDGEAMGAYDSGPLEWEAHWKEGKLHGVYREWHPNGNRKLERIYLAGKKLSEFRWAQAGNNPALERFEYGKKMEWAFLEIKKFDGLTCKQLHFALGAPDNVNGMTLTYLNLKIHDSQKKIWQGANFQMQSNRVSTLTFTNELKALPTEQP